MYPTLYTKSECINTFENKATNAVSSTVVPATIGKACKTVRIVVGRVNCRLNGISLDKRFGRLHELGLRCWHNSH